MQGKKWVVPMWARLTPEMRRQLFELRKKLRRRR